MRTAKQETDARETFVQELHTAITKAGENEVPVDVIISEMWCALNGVTMCKKRHRDAIIEVLKAP